MGFHQKVLSFTLNERQEVIKNFFEEAIKKSVGEVNKHHVNRFSARNRRYMLAYMNQAREIRDSPPNLTYHDIEKFQKNFKSHKNTEDQDWGYIVEVWRESYLCYDQNN